MKHKVGFTLLIIGGTLMIISSAIGSIGVYEFLRDYISGQINIEWIKQVLNVFVEILRWIADLGGIVVIVGAVLIMFNQIRLGKWLIGIGLTFGTLALIILIISQIGDFAGISIPYIDRLKGFFTYNTGLEFIGVTSAIVGRIFVKKPKKVKEEGAEEAEITEEKEEIEPTPPVPFQNIYCPNCGTSLPFNAQFCSECGSTFDRE